MRVQFLQASLGGVLEHTVADLPHDGARWSTSPAPSVTLYDKGGGELVASTLCSTVGVKLFSTSTTAGASVVPLFSTTDLERWGEVVVGPNALGQWEWATIDSVSTGGIGLLGTLRYAYPLSTRCKTHDLRVRVSSGVLSTVSQDCRAAWAYTIKGPPPAKKPVQRKEHSTFHVSYYAPRYTLTEADVLQADSRARKVIGSDQRIDLLLKRLWESRVLPDIARIMHPGAVVSGEACDELLMLAWLRRTSEMAANIEWTDRYNERYQAALAGLQQQAVDLDESGSTDDGEIVRSPRTPRTMRG